MYCHSVYISAPFIPLNFISCRHRNVDNFIVLTVITKGIVNVIINFCFFCSKESSRKVAANWTIRYMQLGFLINDIASCCTVKIRTKETPFFSSVYKIGLKMFSRCS